MKLDQLANAAAPFGYACDRCETFEQRPASVWCTQCGNELSVFDRPADAEASRTYQKLGGALRSYGVACSTVLIAAALAFDPIGKIVIAPFALLIVLIAGMFLALVFVGRYELAALVRNRKFRVVHGLEHACIALLRERGLPTRNGMTSKGKFEIDALSGTTPDDIKDATTAAIARILAGETSLAYTPKCGTSSLVALTLYALIVAGGGVTSILFGVPMGAVMLGCAVLCVIAQLVTRPLGLFAQRMLTVSTTFTSATVGAVRVKTGRRGARYVVPVTVV